MVKKKNHRHPPKPSLTHLSHELVQQHRRHQQLQHKETTKQKRLQAKLQHNKLHRKSRPLYAASDRVLLLGEGNCSFAHSLVATNTVDPAKLVVTTFDTEAELAAKYDDSQQFLASLKSLHVPVYHSVDATRLHSNTEPFPQYRPHSHSDVMDVSQCAKYGRFDKLVFNFPHTGCGITDTDANIQHHQQFLKAVFQSVVQSHLLKPVTGELHIALKRGDPYNQWNIAKIAQSQPSLKLKNAVPFNFANYPEYSHRRTIGFKHGVSSDENEDVLKSGATVYIFTCERLPLDDRLDECDRVREAYEANERERSAMRASVRSIVSAYDTTGETTIDDEDETEPLVVARASADQVAGSDSAGSDDETSSVVAPDDDVMSEVQNVEQASAPLPLPLPLPPPPMKRAKIGLVRLLLAGQSKVATTSSANTIAQRSKKTKR